MKTPLPISHSPNTLFPLLTLSPNTPQPIFPQFPNLLFYKSLNLHRRRCSFHRFKAYCSNPTKTATFQQAETESSSKLEDQFEIVEIKDGFVPPHLSYPKLSLSDRAFFLLAFIGCTTSVAFASLVIAAVPTLYAMGRAATSLSNLANTAREELPSTMAAIRLSGMEISDLTLELNDLSQEIADGVNKSAQAVQAAEAGIRQIGSRAHQQTMSMIEERANLPVISIQPVVTGAAKKTTRAVGQATKTLMNFISRGDFSSRDVDDNGTEL